MIMLTPDTLGTMLVLAEHGHTMNDLPGLKGVSDTFEKEAAILGRLIARSAAEIMDECGMGNTAPSCHLAMISKQADWTPQCQDVVDIVLKVAAALQPMEKAAFNLGDVTGAAESLAKGVGYGTLGAGIGAGTLWWLLNRHATQDDAKAQAMQLQADYYNQLSAELDEQLRRKYQYGQDEKNRKRR